MKNNLQRKVINIDKANTAPIWTLKELDNAILPLELFKNSVAFDITGQTVILGAKTSKGLIEQTDGFTINKNQIDIELKNSILVPGKVEIDLEIKDASGTMTTASFFIIVTAKVLSGPALEANSEFDRLTKAVEDINEDYESLKGGLLAEDKVVYFQNEIKKTNASLETKASKDEVFSMANMGQDVKEAMTGGSVAVVGKDAVLEENLNPSLKNNICMVTKTSSFTNKIKNNKLTDNSNWSTNLATIKSITNGECTFIATGKFGNVLQMGLSFTSGRKYYIGVKAKTLSTKLALSITSSAGGTLWTSSNFSGTGSWEYKSIIYTATTNMSDGQFKLPDYSDSGWVDVTFTKPVIFDLTEIYGAGNEPSIATFENYLVNNFGDKYADEIAFYDDTDLKKKITPSINEVVTPLLISNKKPPIFCNIANDVINVISKYGDNKDINVTLKKKGANNIFDFYQVKLIDNLEVSLSTDITAGTILNTSDTDWHCPFVIRASNNVNGDNPTSYQFTGGNHAYNGDATGTPTGRTASVELFVDGKKITSGIAYGYFIEIRWINYIQASNTKKNDGSGREVMKEIHSMFFDGYKWETHVELEILEDCYISTLYGFQANIKSSWDTKVRYVNGINRGVYAGNIDSNSGNKESNKIICVKDSNALSIELDNKYDIGDKRAYLSTSENKGAFCSLYGKVYFKLADSLDAKAGSYYYRGVYKFYPI